MTSSFQFIHQVLIRESCKVGLAKLVEALFAWRRPTAVLGRVWAIIVDAVDAVPWRRSWSHVVKEGLEGLTPACADGYASPAPILVPWRLRVLAAVDHVAPSAVLGGPTRVVFGRLLAHHLASEAAATSGAPMYEGRVDYDCGIAAVALTTPPCVVVVPSVRFKDKKSPESLSSKINPLHREYLSRRGWWVGRVSARPSLIVGA